MTYDQNSTRGSDNSFAKARDEAQTKIAQTSEKVRDQAQKKFDENRDYAAGGIDAVAHAAQAAAQDLREHNQDGLSRYVTEIADGVSSVANSLRNKNVDELVHEVESIARRNPTLFIAGSIAIGLGIGRFARASSRHNASSSSEKWGSSSYTDNNFSNTGNRDFSSENYPEHAAGYGSERVTDEDYQADDYAATSPDSLTDDNYDLSSSDLLNDQERDLSGRQNRDTTISRSTSTARPSTNSGSLNKSNSTNPFGGDL